MKKYDKLIFVCKTNTAVSPMAEAIMQELLKLDDILIVSKGIVVLFPEPVNPKAEAILASHSLTMKSHTSEPLVVDDFDQRTLILAMDPEQKEMIVSEFHRADNLFTLPEYLGIEEEISDPYGGTLADYGACFEQLDRMLKMLAEQLRQEDA